MDFWGRARAAGAEEYGKARAERYGRQERVKAGVQVLLCIALAIGIVALFVTR